MDTREHEIETIETAIGGLCRKSLISARKLDSVARVFGVNLPNLPDGVQQLIDSTRALIAEQGYSKRDSDYILFGIYTAVHWDWDQPTDRVFETMLEFELADFFKGQTIQ
jgi:hypothetical protein